MKCPKGSGGGQPAELEKLRESGEISRKRHFQMLGRGCQACLAMGEVVRELAPRQPPAYNEMRWKYPARPAAATKVLISLREMELRLAERDGYLLANAMLYPAIT